jgi:uncharacterized protein YbgA (DUF1722 family)/uncharacterized protein YbbK (DUF523 family)
MQKPVIGISSCLLGNNVRYDGGHKLDRFLKDVLGQFVEFAPVCPEHECGLSIPREAMRLVDFDGEIKLMTQRTGKDITPQMKSWMGPVLEEFGKKKLCGFVFKANSPSSGMERVKVYNEKGFSSKIGVGIFAQAFMDKFPCLPVEEEGRLNDDNLRENFIERVFVFQRWNDLLDRKKTVGELVRFHTAHKYLIMSHSDTGLRELGKLVASAKSYPIEEVYGKYLELLSKYLKLTATRKKNANVLQHIMGYFKKQLDTDEKAELNEVITKYHDGLVPQIVPITLLNHYVRKFKPEYLADQLYLNPHPLELKLRNHA